MVHILDHETDDSLVSSNLLNYNKDISIPTESSAESLSPPTTEEDDEYDDALSVPKRRKVRQDKDERSLFSPPNVDTIYYSHDQSDLSNKHEKTDTTDDNNTAAPSSSSSSPQTTDGPCTECHTVETPQWRRGPHGYRTLCNACGLRWAKQQNGLTNNGLVPKKKTKPKKRKQQKRSGDSLFDKKEYITHGLYSAETRGVPALSPRAFHVPLPIHQGEIIMSTVKDFELPPYLHQERELDLIKSLIDKTPVFKKIKTNIFVERKAKTNTKDSVTCQCTPPKNDKEVGCGDNCLNRMLFYECDPKNCPCGKKCTNRRFHKDQVEPDCEVFRTEKRGWGLRTKEDIKKGQFIIEYCGEIISRELCEERMCTIYVNEKNFYFLEYSKGEVIDACTKGTNARFINHSCDPNCHIEKWSFRGESHFGVFASKDIPAYTELSYDYNFLTFNVENAQVCHCGSKRCRGTIGKKITTDKKTTTDKETTTDKKTTTGKRKRS